MQIDPAIYAYVHGAGALISTGLLGLFGYLGKRGLSKMDANNAKMEETRQAVHVLMDTIKNFPPHIHTVCDSKTCDIAYPAGYEVPKVVHSAARTAGVGVGD